MNILITGAAGFLGSAVVRAAARQGHTPLAMMRAHSPASDLDLPAEQFRHADMLHPETFGEALTGAEAVIHCAAITSAGATDAELSRRVNVEGTRSLYAAARDAGVRRWIQVSSMSAHPAGTSVYGTTKREADDVLRTAESGPVWTIVRPSLIYGPGRRGLVAKTTELLKKLPVLPLIGSGRERIRPVYVDDVAEACLTLIPRQDLAGREYMLGGADEVELREFMKRLAAAGAQPKPLLPLPIPICHLLARVLAMVSDSPPITVDNVLGVKEAVCVDQSGAERDFDYRPISLDEGLRRTFGTRPS